MLFNCNWIIDEPGTYSLDADIITNNCAIEVAADDVVLNLNGFSLIGPNDSSAINYGIVGVNRSNVSISGGNISGFSFGIALTSSRGIGYDTSGNTVKSVNVSDSSLRGIQVEGYRTQIINTKVTNTGGSTYYPDAYGFGIEVIGPDCLVTDNIVTETFGSFSPGLQIGEGVGISFSTYNTYCVAENNTIYNSRSVSNKSTLGFWVDKYSQVTLRNNYIRNMHYSGLVPVFTKLDNNDTDIPIAYGADDRD